MVANTNRSIPRIAGAIAWTLACVLAAFGETGADAFKWTDPDGVTHYSQYPPPGQAAQRIGTDGTVRRADPGPRRRLDEELKKLDELKQERAKAEEEQAKARAEAERRATNCERARQNLANLEIATRRLVQQPDGSVQRLTEEERQERMAEARKQIEENCDN